MIILKNNFKDRINFELGKNKDLTQNKRLHILITRDSNNEKFERDARLRMSLKLDGDNLRI